ncbi:MAG: 50S ribosomal protein L15e [Euryarchaeota archaeon]|jgi:large subunit ribosomal protein L15e|nr:50S ribosomal protein L15e [Euryarchaeota archaeon]
MSKGMSHHLRETWKRPKDNIPSDYRRERMTKWRSEPVFHRVAKPTRIDAARRVGYKAKQGVTVVRTRIRRGGLRKSKINAKRKPSKMGMRKITMAKSTQRLAEERVAKKYPNMEVLNSYWVGEDGKQKFFEVILVDPNHPVIKADKQLGWVGSSSRQRGRVHRGKTSAGKRGRGLYNKGKGAEKLRPSLKANLNRGK